MAGGGPGEKSSTAVIARSLTGHEDVKLLRNTPAKFMGP